MSRHAQPSYSGDIVPTVTEGHRDTKGWSRMFTMDNGMGTRGRIQLQTFAMDLCVCLCV